jgi:hypothetical protein
MADRKKQPTRGARKRKPAKAKPKTELRPLKIAGCQLVVGTYNEKGQLVGEQIVTPQPFTLYEPEFGDVPRLVRQFMKQVREASEAQEPTNPQPE